MRITVAPTGINATSAACFSRFTKAVHSDTSIGFPATAAGGLPNGAGVAARVAIEQAAASDPTHRMMQLVGQMLQEACTSGDVRVGPGGRNLDLRHLRQGVHEHCPPRPHGLRWQRRPPCTPSYTDGSTQNFNSSYTVLNAVITAQPGSHPVLTATPAKIFTQIHMRTAVSVPSCCNDTNRDNLQQHPPRRARRETRSETWRVKPGEHAEFWVPWSRP